MNLSESGPPAPGSEPSRDDVSFSARLRRAYGADVDPGISLEPESASTPARGSAESSTASSGRLEKLAARAPSGGRYDVRGEIARGGMGAILEVWDEDLRRTLAMKVILGPGDEGTASDAPSIEPDKLSRFLEEAQITGQLDHPGIVPVHDLGIDASGRVYFTMPLIKGRDLKEVFALAREGRDGWTRPRALGVFLRICDAMAFAHSKGVLHRDLKPTNIMVGRFGETYVMDWGLAKVLGRPDRRDVRPRREPTSISGLSIVRTDRHDETSQDPESPVVTMDGDVVGTPAYMSPEQAQGRTEEIGPHADVYSVGAMLYHMLSGQMPYVGPTERVSPYTVLNAVRTGPPARLHVLDPTLSPELCAICEKAMAREPQERYPSMRAMGEDLRNFLEGRVVTAYESGRFARARKWVERNRGLAALIALSVVLTLGGLGVVLALEVEARRQAENAEQAAVRAKQQVDALLVQSRENEAEAVRARRRADESLEIAEAREMQVRRENLVANLSVADYSLRLNEVEEAQRRLEACDPALRDWEWRHLALKADTSLAKIDIGNAAVPNALFSPSGAVVAVAGSEVLVVHPENGEVVVRWKTGSLWVTALAMSRDGRLVALGVLAPLQQLRNVGVPVQVWDVARQELVASLAGHGHVVAVAFDPSGTRLATADDDRERGCTLRLWDLAHGTTVFERSMADDPLLSLAFGPGGDLAAGTKGGNIDFVSPVDGELVRTVAAHDGPIRAIEHDAAGARLLSASDDKTAKLWNAAEATLECTLVGHTGPVRDATFAPDGRTIATASADTSARLWDAATGEELTMLRGHTDQVGSVGFNVRGDRLVTAGTDDALRVWDPRWSLAQLVLIGHSDRVSGLAFDPDGRVLYSSSFDRSVQSWDLDQGSAYAARRDADRRVYSVACSRDGELLASGDSGGILRLWPADSDAAALEVAAHDGRVNAVSFAPSGVQVVTGGSDGDVHVWNSASGRRVASYEGHRRAVADVEYSRDGERLLAAAFDRDVLVWDVASGAVLARLAHDKWVNAATFSPDGGWIATACDDGDVYVWDAASGALHERLVGHQGSVLDVAFGPHGRRLVSGGTDGTARVWDPLHAMQLLTLRTAPEAKSSTPVRCVAFSPDGARVAASTVPHDADRRTEPGEIWVWETGANVARSRLRRAYQFVSTRARPLVDGLFRELAFVEDVVARLLTDQSIEDELREVAVRMARVSEEDYEAMFRDAWNVVVEPGHTPGEFAEAHRKAAAALDALRSPAHLVGFAAAQFRMGYFDRAAATLSEVRESQPDWDRLGPAERVAYWAFNALNAAALGRSPDARNALAELESCWAAQRDAGAAEPWMEPLAQEARTRVES